MRAARTARGWGRAATDSAGRDSPPGISSRGAREAWGLLHQIRLVRPEAGGHLSQPDGQAGGYGLQFGQHPVAQAVSGVCVVPVGSVLPPGQPPEAEIRLDLIPRDGQQGTDHIPLTGADPSQAAQPGPPDQVEQDGLRVIPGVVGGGDPLGPAGPGGPAEKIIAHVPGGLLHTAAAAAGLSGHIAAPDEQFHRGQVPPCPVGLEQAVPPAAQGDELADEGRVPVGLLPTQLVVVVGGGQCKGDLPAQSVQLVEQAHGVRSAGYGAQDGAAGGDQLPRQKQTACKITHRSSRAPFWG